MTKLDNPMSFKRLGGRARRSCVSSTPSKIPYVGFSPVRLQTGVQPQPSSRNALGLYAARSPGVRPLALAGMYGGVFALDVPVQRPLARQRVMLSRQVIAYYGLIRDSQSLPLTYVFASGSLPSGRDREVPHFTLRVLLSVPPPVPRRTGRLQVVVASPTVVAFAQSARARHPLGHASRFSRGSVTRLQSSLYAAARRFARPTPTRTFTFELSSHESPHWNVEYNYAGKQPIPAAGLTPAGHAALWAASR